MQKLLGDGTWNTRAIPEFYCGGGGGSGGDEGDR